MRYSEIVRISYYLKNGVVLEVFKTLMELFASLGALGVTISVNIPVLMRLVISFSLVYNMSRALNLQIISVSLRSDRA